MNKMEMRPKRVMRRTLDTGLQRLDNSKNEHQWKLVAVLQCFDLIIKTCISKLHIVLHTCNHFS